MGFLFCSTSLVLLAGVERDLTPVAMLLVIVAKTSKQVMRTACLGEMTCVAKISGAGR
jgi:hypothetical protein